MSKGFVFKILRIARNIESEFLELLLRLVETVTTCYCEYNNLWLQLLVTVAASVGVLNCLRLLATVTCCVPITNCDFDYDHLHLLMTSTIHVYATIYDLDKF